ncbi:hypothetical protein RRG08_030201, partial [Elysia crispata]
IKRVSDNTQVGSIARTETGGCCNQNESIILDFPKDLNVNHKALMLAAVFQLDFLVFDKPRYCLPCS